MLSPYEYSLYQYERSRGSFQSRNQFASLYGNYDQLDSLYSGLNGTDWQKEVFGKTTTSVYHNISITGGSDNSNFNLSYSRNNDQGIMLGSGYTRNTVNFKYHNQSAKKLKVDFDARYSNTDVLGAGTSDPGTSSQNRLKNAVLYRPINGLYDFNNDPSLYVDNEEYYNSTGLTDPVKLINDEYRNEITSIINLNGSLDYTIIKGLAVKSEVGLNSRQQKQDRFYGLTSYLARKYGDLPVVRVYNNRQNIFRITNTLRYGTKLGGDHDISVLLGQEMINTDNNNFNMEIHSYPAAIPRELALGMLSLGTEPQFPESDISKEKLFSYFGRVMYNYKEKYLGNVTLRADGSSKFFKSNKWGIFPSASFAWRMSQEDFMKNVPFISSLKPRVSFGEAGNNRIDNNLFLKRFTSSASKPYYINDQPQAYLYVPELANPNLKWETTISRDIGLDMGLFRDRITSTFDMYYNTTKNLLIRSPLDPSSGYPDQVQNIGQTTNKGIELAVNTVVIERNDFQLNVNFNISFNRNKVDKLGNGLTQMLENSRWNNDIGSDYIVEVGQPVGLMYGFVTDGFYTADDFSSYDPGTGKYTLKPGVADNGDLINSPLTPGTIKFMNLANPIDSSGHYVSDGYKVTNDLDRTVIGNANPKHTGGLNIMMSYKGLDLSIFLNWVYGNDIYNANKIEFTSGYRAYTNLLDDMNSGNRWRTIDDQGNVVTDLAALAELNKNATIWKPPTGNYLFHSWAVEDGSFLRINNVTLGYTIPERISKKVLIQKLRAYITINNLYTFTKYSGYDPEVDTRRDTPMTPGVDYSAYPRSRMFLFGLNVTL